MRGVPLKAVQELLGHSTIFGVGVRLYRNVVAYADSDSSGRNPIPPGIARGVADAALRVVGGR
jgi:hypothetical protein